MTDLSHLMQAIDECGDRLNAANNILAQHKAYVHDLEIEHSALMRALALATPQAEPVAEPPTPHVPEQTPREKCAALILEDYANNALPDGMDDLPQTYHEAFNARTLRSAITIAHRLRAKESRAAPETVSGIPTAERTAVSSLPEAPPKR